MILGDSAAKWDVDSRKVIADTFTMSLKKLVVDDIAAKKVASNVVTADTLKATSEIIGQTVFADTVKTNNLFMDTMASLNMRVDKTLTVKDIIAKYIQVKQSVVIDGTGVNGAALTVNGGEIVANRGIVSHTVNNRFQTMEIMGGGTASPAYCFIVDRGVNSLFQGNVTIEGEDSKLILDGSTLATDNVLVTPISYITSFSQSTNTKGVQLTTQQNWDEYVDDMVEEYDDQANASPDYDPYQTVADAMERNRVNYENAQERVKTLVNPISYAMEHSNPNVPKRFVVKDGIYRLDSNGNTLSKNLVCEQGKFSKLEAYEFNINNINIDKVVTTSVASNVVDTDNLLKSRGLAEFDGSVHVGGDVFMEDGSKTNVADGAKVTFHEGSVLDMKNGSTLNMGVNTTVRMSGDIEIDVNKLMFVDSKTGIKCRLVIRKAVGTEGTGVVVEYVPVDGDDSSGSRVVNDTRLATRELDEKLKSLGV